MKLVQIIPTLAMAFVPRTLCMAMLTPEDRFPGLDRVDPFSCCRKLVGQQFLLLGRLGQIRVIQRIKLLLGLALLLIQGSFFPVLVIHDTVIKA